MVSWLLATPGRLYVVATLCRWPSFSLLLVAGGDSQLLPPLPRGAAGWLGSSTSSSAATARCDAGAYLRPRPSPARRCSASIGLVTFLDERTRQSTIERRAARWAERTPLGPGRRELDPGRRLRLELGYRIDHLTAVMFAMVTFVAPDLHFLDRLHGTTRAEDRVRHERPHERAGTPSRAAGGTAGSSCYLSLFCFSMLNLVIADNLFQVFV